MKLSDFDYILPPERIAAEPAEPRDAARLLDMRDGKLADRLVSDLPACIDPGDLLIVNNTKVLPARLIGKRGEATISITLHQRVSDNRWKCFARPAKKLRLGDLVVFGEDFTAEIT